MQRALARILVGLVLFVGAAAVGFFATQRMASESLRVEAEERLSRFVGAPVTVEDVRLAFGFGIRLEGSDVRVWGDGKSAPSLQVDRVRASVRTLSLILGRPKFGRIVLDGARLRIERDAEGLWSPAPVAKWVAKRHTSLGPDPPHPDELLSPLIAVENTMRTLLEKRRVADVIELRHTTIVFVDARAERPLAPPLFLALESVRAELRRSRLTRASHLTFRAQLTDAHRTRGSVEWEGTRNRHGAIRTAVAVTDLDLTALAPYVRSLHPAARIDGSLSGTVVFETGSPGVGRLEVDLVGHDVRSVEPRAEGTTIAANRVEVVGALAISPQTVRLEGARIRGGDFSLEVDGTVARPLRSNSFAQVALAFQEVEVSDVRHLIGWLPEVEREEAESVVQVVESGRLHSLRAGGSATLSDWQAFLAGRTRTPPAEFLLDATLSDTVVRVGEDDRLEDLQGRLWWSGDHAEVVDARATLNGSPLPIFDVAIDGVTNFLAGDPERRRLASGGVPLLGLRPLWETFRPEPDAAGPKTRVALGLVVDRLHHPMFLWPIENTSAVLWDTDHGIHIVADGGTWAGVPVSGEADWVFEPEERVRVDLAARPPEPDAPGPGPSPNWAEGSIVFGIRQEGPWGQQHGVTRFRARGGNFHFDDVEVTLNPRGEVDASIDVNLGLSDRAPFDVSFAVTGAEVEALARQLGQPPEMGTGTVDLAGSFRGVLRPGHSLLDGLSGLLDVVAVDGTIRQSIPAVVAVALASRAFNPFIRRDEVRYERCETTLEFEDGRMSTSGFSLDGPDMRVFAIGELDLANEPHEVDAQVALFLFRQIDNIIDKIPIVNVLLLGTNDNLVGAHFRLTGPWEDPRATAVPLRALASGPASIVEQGPTSLVLQTIPMFMMKGIEAIESMLGLGKSAGRDREHRKTPAAEPDAS